MLIHYRPLIPDPATYSGSIGNHPSYIHCMSAARSCIRASELLRERVPPSHHLSFCIHHLALSGITLYTPPSLYSTTTLQSNRTNPRLRISRLTDENVTDEVLLCSSYIGDLEHCFSGASKYRVILQELLRSNEQGHSNNWGLMSFMLDVDDRYALGCFS